MKIYLVIIMLMVPLLVRIFFYFDSQHIYKEGEKFHKSYNIMKEPKKNAASQYFFIDGVFISLPLYPSLYYGETIEIDGVVTKLTTGKGGLLAIKNPQITRVENNNPLLFVTKFIRERVVESTITVMPEREAGLLLGIILGVRDKIDSKFYKDLQKVGVLHVVAASGQNVSIVAGILLISLQKVVKRRKAIIFTILGILFYSLLSGFDPPIVRASIMAILAFAAMVMGRQSSGAYVLLLTGWVMLVVDPSLLTNTSFHLSFLATAGILFVKPLLDKITRLKKIDVIKDDVTTTISAQLTTIPVLFAVFGSYSLLSLPVNILILWTVPVLMIVGGLGAIASVVLPVFAVPFLLLCYPFLMYFTFITDVASRFSLTIDVSNLPQIFILGYYLMLFGIVFGLGKKGVKKI